MKEELQGKLVEILTNIQAAAGKASDFAVEQLPDIAQSYIAYGRMWESLWTGAFAAAFVAFLFVALRFGYLNKKAADRDGDWLETRIAAAVLGTGGTLFCGAVTLSSMSSFLLVWVAPKVWLLKELAHMVK